MPQPQPGAARTPETHRSLAWPLAATWTALIVYASWHPFTGWRWPLRLNWPDLPAMLWLPMPIHSSAFDLSSNVVGYLPLGLLLALGTLAREADHPPLRGRWRLELRALLVAALAPCALSLCMEFGQHFLPKRVPSRVDWMLNTSGAIAGAVVALWWARLGVLTLWHELRTRWFALHSPWGLALLITWPAALLFPPALPLALGHVMAPLQESLGQFMAQTPWESTWITWLPAAFQQTTANDPMGPLAEMLAITLGAMAPGFVAYAMGRRTFHRLVAMAGAISMGVAMSSLSTTLHFGPEHAWDWLTAAVPPALCLAAVLSFGMAWLPHRWCSVAGTAGLAFMLWLVNQTQPDPYFSLSLQGWEQGRFVRFHGLSQWLSWLWPLAAMGFLMARTLDRQPRQRAPSPEAGSTP